MTTLTTVGYGDPDALSDWRRRDRSSAHTPSFPSAVLIAEKISRKITKFYAETLS